MEKRTFKSQIIVKERNEYCEKCRKLPWTHVVDSIESAYDFINLCYEEDKAYDQYIPNLYEILIYVWDNNGWQTYTIIKVDG